MKKILLLIAIAAAASSLAQQRVEVATCIDEPLRVQPQGLPMRPKKLDNGPQNGYAYYYRPAGSFYQGPSIKDSYFFLKNTSLVLRPYSSHTFRARSAKNYEWNYQVGGSWFTETGNQTLSVEYGLEIDSLPKLKIGVGNTFIPKAYDWETGEMVWSEVFSIADPEAYRRDYYNDDYYVSPKWCGGERNSGGNPYRDYMTFRETDEIGNHTYHSHAGRNDWGYDSVSLWIDAPKFPYLLRGLYIVHQNLLMKHDSIVNIDVIVRKVKKDFDSDNIQPGEQIAQSMFSVDSSMVACDTIIVEGQDTLISFQSQHGTIVTFSEPMIIHSEILITITGYNNENIERFSLRYLKDIWDEGYGDHCYVYHESKGWLPMNREWGYFIDNHETYISGYYEGCSLAPSIFLDVKFPYTMLCDEDDTGVRQVGGAGGRLAIELKSSDPGSEQQVTIESATPGSDDVSWFTVGFTDGEVSELGEHRLTANLDVAANTTGAPRSAQVTITMPASPTVTLVVNQGTGVTGDVNGDGTVDISDVNAVINVMLGKAESTPAADINGDGTVDVSDVNMVINIMLGKL